MSFFIATYARHFLRSTSTIIMGVLIVLPQLAHAFIHQQVVVGTNSGGEGPLGNTLPGITLSATTNLDFIELPIVATKDGHLLVYNSLLLDPATDVSEIFPEKARKDGRYHTVDFTLHEIWQLRKLPQQLSPRMLPSLAIPTLDEALGVVQLIEEQRGTSIGIILCLVEPGYHSNNGKDISMLTLHLLRQYQYPAPGRTIMIESEDSDELQRLKNVLFPEMEMEVPLIQIIDVEGASSSYDLNWMLTRLGLRVISSYADVLSLHTSFITGMSPQPMPEAYLEDARALGLKIYTFPVEQPHLSPLDQPASPQTPTTQAQINEPQQPIDNFLENPAIDGIITDSPTVVLLYKRKKELRTQLQRRAEQLK